MEGLELSSRVTRPEAEDAGDAGSDVRIALLDLGNKENITRCLTSGAPLSGSSHGYTPAEMQAWSPTGG